MGYFVRDGKIYRQYVGLNCQIHHEYVEPAPKPTAYSIALRIMSKYEHRKNTDNRNYRYAQKVACRELILKWR